MAYNGTMTVSVDLSRDLSSWLRRRSRELGVSESELVADVLRRKQAAEEFRALTAEMSAEARARGLTAEKLTELLDGEKYE